MLACVSLLYAFRASAVAYFQVAASTGPGRHCGIYAGAKVQDTTLAESLEDIFQPPSGAAGGASPRA